jgi:hypothetical protein
MLEYINDTEYSHFEDSNGNHYALNGSPEEGEIEHMFSNGYLFFYIAVENGFDINLKLIKKEYNSYD